MALTPTEEIQIENTRAGLGAGLSNAFIEADFNKRQRAHNLFAVDEMDVLFGQLSGSTEGLMHRTAAATKAHATESRTDKKRKQDASDAHFRNILALIRGGQVSSYIADEIFDNKTDLEIRDIVAEIEAATGDSFENYAREILGDEVPKRLDGESEADHQRRDLKAIAEEVLHPETGVVKAEYADDPVAKIVQREQVYQEIRRDVDSLNERAEREGVTVEIDNDVDDNTVNNYNAADLHGNGLNAGSLVKVSRGNQDGARDTVVAAMPAAEDNATFLDELPFDESSVDVAAAEGRKAFNEHASPSTNQAEMVSTNDPAPSIKPA